MPKITSYQLPLSRGPDLSRLSAREWAYLTSIDAEFETEPDGPHLDELRRMLARYVQGPNQWRGIKPTRHKLSPHFRKLNPFTEFDEQRTLREVKTYDWLIDRVPKGGSLLDSLNTDLLLEIVTVMMRSGIRNGKINTKPDCHGVTVVFPPVDRIPDQLKHICLTVQETAVVSRPLAAITGLSLIKNLHPLNDGNGRLARLLFNIVIWKSPSLGKYLPLYEFAKASCGSEAISLREAHYFQENESLFRYFAIIARLAKSSVYTWCQ